MRERHKADPYGARERAREVVSRARRENSQPYGARERARNRVLKLVNYFFPEIFREVDPQSRSTSLVFRELLQYVFVSSGSKTLVVNNIQWQCTAFLHTLFVTSRMTFYTQRDLDEYN